jgi:hypothetical protein
MNRKFTASKLILLILILSLLSIYAAINYAGSAKTFVGPTLKGRLLGPFFDEFAYSILGEAGVKNYRVGGTLGWEPTDEQRLKLSAEYLRQKLNYSFFSGDTAQWMNQGAIGLGYQHRILENSYDPQFDVDAFYSYAPNKTLNTITTTTTNGTITQTITDMRRIAGGRAAGISTGFDWAAWQGSRLGADLNYDHINYRKKYAPNENAIGFGGTVWLNQAINNNIDVNLAASVRQAFNYYVARLAWVRIPQYKNLSVGIEGDYIAGKQTLPTSYNAAVTLDYYLDCASVGNKAYKNFKGELAYEWVAPTAQRLRNWVSDPAVYMPQVLAISDEAVNINIQGPAGCGDGNVVLIGPIPDPPDADVTFGPVTVVVPTAPFFTGNNLVFSETHVSVVPFPPPFNIQPIISINSSTGVVSVTGGDVSPATVTMNVTASNACGSATATFVVTFISD